MGITGFEDEELERISTRFIRDKNNNIPGAIEAHAMWVDDLQSDAKSVRYVFEHLSNPYMDQIRGKLVALKLQGKRLENADQLK